LIYGSGELAFFYDFNEEAIQDDSRLGYDTGASPDYIVVSPKYEKNFERDGKGDPGFLDFVEERLTKEYRLIYEGRRYSFLARRDGDS
jgi:hypothetical protein